MPSTTIMITITLAITLFLAYIRVKDYITHKQVIKAVSEKDVFVEKVTRKSQRNMFYLFIVLALIFLLILIFLSPELGNLLENATYVGVFVILAGSEWCNYKTVETIEVFEKHVVYSTFEFKIKNIRNMLASGKKNTNVFMNDGTSSLVPNDVSAKLTALQKARKAK